MSGKIKVGDKGEIQTKDEPTGGIEAFRFETEIIGADEAIREAMGAGATFTNTVSLQPGDAVKGTFRGYETQPFTTDKGETIPLDWLIIEQAGFGFTRIKANYMILAGMVSARIGDTVTIVRPREPYEIMTRRGYRVFPFFVAVRGQDGRSLSGRNWSSVPRSRPEFAAVAENAALVAHEPETAEVVTTVEENETK